MIDYVKHVYRQYTSDIYEMVVVELQLLVYYVFSAF